MEAMPANDRSLSPQQAFLRELNSDVSKLNQPVCHLHRKRQHSRHRIATLIRSQTLRQIQHPPALRIDRPARSSERADLFENLPIAAQLLRVQFRISTTQIERIKARR